MIFKAEERHLNIVKEITQQTISEIYPHYYPTGAVDFFKNHHNDSNIFSDIKDGIVFLMKDGMDRILTGTLVMNTLML